MLQRSTTVLNDVRVRARSWLGGQLRRGSRTVLLTPRSTRVGNLLYFWLHADIEAAAGRDLRVLRNEIFARHGYVFKDKELQKTFEAMDWYKADPAFTADKVSTVLSEIEFKNVTTLKKAEEVAISKLTEVEG